MMVAASRLLIHMTGGYLHQRHKTDDYPHFQGTIYPRCSDVPTEVDWHLCLLAGVVHRVRFETLFVGFVAAEEAFLII